ncbi:transposable element Tcb2 transposase [Trichonephila clavipes]|nr:transposable element Tcb2 transposase [Trichonephila clavipes]
MLVMAKGVMQLPLRRGTTWAEDTDKPLCLLVCRKVFYFPLLPLGKPMRHSLSTTQRRPLGGYRLPGDSTVLPVCNGVVRHHNWTEQDWACVLFSDESRFSLSSDCRRQLIWRESGTAYRPENIREKDRYPTCSIMVWAGIMINGQHGPTCGCEWDYDGPKAYIDEVLLPHDLLFRGAVGDKFVFMDDNATCHRTLAVQDCLRQRGYSTSRMASVFSRSKPH